MKRFPQLLALAAIGCLSTACDGDKPSEDDCRRAIAHILELHGNPDGSTGADPKKMVSACRSMSSKKTVACFLAAEDKEDLKKCEGDVKVPAPAGQEEPSKEKEEPAAAKEEPAAAKEEPAAAKEEPAAAKEEPAAAKEEPAAAKEEPAAAKEEAAKTE